MADVRRRRRRSRDIVAADLDVMPLMNLFIVLIPLLLLSAVFIEVSVIDMALPSAAEAAQDPAERLDLAVHVGTDAYVIRANGHAPRTIARMQAEGSHAPDDDTRARLGEALREISGSVPGNDAAKIVSGPRTRYEEIVALMDVARDAGLPHTSLAAAEGDPS